MARVHNFYYHCSVEWDDDDCDSFHNDDCPICGKEIEPYSSNDVNGETPMKTFQMNKKITPANDMFLYYVAGDDVCTTSRGYADSDEAVEAFADEYPERPRGATHCIGITKEKDGQREGMTVWEG